MSTAIQKHKSLLDELGFSDVNPGACEGSGCWHTDPNGKEFVSLNPTTGEPIATVVQATSDTYEKVLSSVAKAFES